MTVPSGRGSRSMRPMSWLAGSILAATVSLAPTAASQANRPPGPAAQAWSVSSCQDCHAEAFTPAFAKSAHGKADQSCAQCHGNVPEHLKAKEAGEEGGPTPTLKNLKANDLSAKCLTCHEKANQATFVSSKHARRNVSCSTCHSVHTAKSDASLLKAKNDVETCVSCHKTERAKTQRTSHHPVREGKMGCASCHNPHEGARPRMLKAETANELCYQCHTEKRGPFLFEHAPVREDCMSCHDVHGSNHPRMVTQKQPTLCWSCHLSGSGHFGSGDNYSTEKGVPVAPSGSPAGFPTMNSRFIGRACTKCHLNIHGSNSPSGAFFIR